MSTIASLITSLTIVYSIVYSDADQSKHQSSASLAFAWGIHRDRWIPRTKGQLRGKCFHLMTSSWQTPIREFCDVIDICKGILYGSTLNRVLFPFQSQKRNHINEIFITECISYNDITEMKKWPTLKWMSKYPRTPETVFDFHFSSRNRPSGRISRRIHQAPRTGGVWVGNKTYLM